MLLAIDVGNTQTLLGVFEGDEVVADWRVATEAHRTADELAVLLKGLLDSRGPRRPVTGIALCSSVPAVLHELRQMCDRYYEQVPLVVVEPGVRTGIAISTDNPKEVGADRIVNALAAAQLYGGPAIVVDFGTATTFDAVSAKGEYVGGAIAPGIEISVDALGIHGAQLRRVELRRPRSVIGKTTAEALQSGVIFGFAGQVDGIVERMSVDLAPNPDDVTVVATGGLAPLIVAESRTIDVHEPWLTLIGLRLVFERNR